MKYYTLKKQAAAHARPGQIVRFTLGKGYYVYGKAKHQPILVRNRLVTLELAAAKLGIKEVGANNHGPWVKKFLAEVGLPEGYAWCDAFQSYEEHKAAGFKLPIESASVGGTVAMAHKLGWIVQRPYRADLVAYNFGGGMPPHDHIGLVVKVLSIAGAYWKLQTVEGNTGDQNAADGDGVYLRTRLVRKNSVEFIRIPSYTKV